MLYLLFSLFLCSISLPQNLPGARQSALCNSDIAASDDIFAVFSNSAGLYQIPWREAGIHYSPSPFGLTELASKYVAYVEPTDIGPFSLGMMTYGYELYREYKFLFSFSHKLFNNVFIGSTLNYHHLFIKGYGNDGSVYLNVGTLGYITPSIRMGFNVSNVNRATFGEEKNQIPVMVTSGISMGFNNIFFLHLSLHKDIIKDYSVCLGAEYLCDEWLALRSGFSTEPLKYAAGTGIHLNNFSFDYSVSVHRELGITHEISVIFSFFAFKNRQSEIKSYLKNND